MAKPPKKVQFATSCETIEFNKELAEEVHTIDFISTAEKKSVRFTSSVIFHGDVVSTQDATTAVSGNGEILTSFDDMWQKQNDKYHNIIKACDLKLLNAIYEEEGELDDCQLERLQDLEGNLFSAFCDLREMNRRFADCGLLAGFRHSVSVGDWKVVSEVLSTLEEEWKTFEKCELEGENPEALTEEFNNKWIKDVVLAAVKEDPLFLTPGNEQVIRPGFFDRWDDYTKFLNNPVTVFESMKKDFVQKYFKLFDCGVFCSILNGIRVDVTKSSSVNENNSIGTKTGPSTSTPTSPSPFGGTNNNLKGEYLVKKLCAWKVPPGLLAEDPFRANNTPVVAADRSFSCNHSKTDSCRDHPGKLLLLLIRLNMYDMVKFALENGMHVNTCSNYGQCKRLVWITERQNMFYGYSAEDEIAYLHHHKGAHHGFGEALPTDDDYNNANGFRDEAEETIDIDQRSLAQADQDAMEFLKNLKESEEEPDFLKSEYELMTPLAVAVHSAVYGAGLKVVTLLLNLKANPLLCSDAAVKACVNALSLENTTKLKIQARKLKKRKSKVAGADPAPDEIKCLKLIYHLVHTDYKKVKKNHCTKVLLYQAAIERRWEAIEYITNKAHKHPPPVDHATDLTLGNASSDNITEIEDKIGLEMDAFELMLQVIDRLLNDGLQKVYTTYSMVLIPILHFLATFEIYLNNWRFTRVYKIMKLAMQENLPGDSFCVLQLLRNPQLQHFLGLVHDPKWEEKRLENLNIDDRVRSRLRLENRRNSQITLATRKSSKDKQNEKTISAAPISKQMSQLSLFNRNKSKNKLFAKQLDGIDGGGKHENIEKVERLLKLAVKLQSLDIIDELLSKNINPSDNCKFHMIAMAVKAQNCELFQYLYHTVGDETHLKKSFVIALKGKFHQSLQKVFDMGFRVNVPVKLNASTVHKGNGTLDLLGKVLEDVLFERTVFDTDNGLRNKEGFTRDDEERTFSVILEYLVKNLDDGLLQGLVKKILTTAQSTYERRVWFCGFNEFVSILLQHGKFHYIDDQFIDIFAMNYFQWCLYSKDLHKRFSATTKKKRQKKALLRQKILATRARRSKKMPSSTSSEPSLNSHGLALDTEPFLSMTEKKVEYCVNELILKNEGLSANMAKLCKQIRETRDNVGDMNAFARCERTLVAPECRRNNSRNFDYLAMHASVNGTSEML